MDPRQTSDYKTVGNITPTRNTGSITPTRPISRLSAEKEKVAYTSLSAARSTSF